MIVMVPCVLKQMAPEGVIIGHQCAVTLGKLHSLHQAAAYML